MDRRFRGIVSVLMFGSWVLNRGNLHHRSFFSLGRYINVLIQIISFKNEAHFRLGCEIYWNCIVLLVVIKHVALFTIWAKLTMAFIFISLPLNFPHFCFRPDVVVAWFRICTKTLADRRILVKKKAGIGGFAYHYSTPSQLLLCNDRCMNQQMFGSNTEA